MKLTIIGHWGAYPEAGEACSGYLLEHDGYKILLDCGNSVFSELQKYIKFDELQAVVLSHYHSDHFADVSALQNAFFIQSKINEMVERVLPIYGHTYNEDVFNSLTYRDCTVGIKYDAETPVQIGPFTIEFTKTRHSVECFAMRITAAGKTLVYTGDTAYFEELAHFANKADVFLTECSFYKGMDGSKSGHMTSEEVGKIAQMAEVRKVILTHLPHFNKTEQLVIEAKAQFDGEVVLAKKGLVIEL